MNVYGTQTAEHMVREAMLTTWLNTSPGVGETVSGISGRGLVRKLDKKYSTSVDFKLPVVELFDRITRFDQQEAVLRQNGITAPRLRLDNAAGIVLGWDVTLRRQSKLQNIRFVVEQFDKPARISGTAHVYSLEISATIAIMARDRSWSRVMINLVARPRDLRACLILYSLGLKMDQLALLFREMIGAPSNEQATIGANHPDAT